MCGFSLLCSFAANGSEAVAVFGVILELHQQFFVRLVDNDNRSCSAGPLGASKDEVAVLLKHFIHIRLNQFAGV